jgi:hypothetical protein
VSAIDTESAIVIVIAVETVVVIVTGMTAGIAAGIGLEKVVGIAILAETMRDPEEDTVDRAPTHEVAQEIVILGDVSVRGIILGIDTGIIAAVINEMGMKKLNHTRAREKS